MKIYYGHSKRIYDDPQEEIELDFIRKKFPAATVICPNHDLGELSDYKEYLRIVDDCTMVVASEVGGSVGKGVL